MKKIIFILTLIFISSNSTFCKADKIEDFDNFLIEFKKNKSFQVSRIKFPLLLEYLDNSDYKVKKFEYNSFNWKHDDLNIKSDVHTTIDNGEEKYVKILSFMGVENGINLKYFFKAFGINWYLIKIESMST
jgi:hypothetical protein